MQGQPFTSGEVANLTSFGLENQHFKFGVLSFETDKYISVKEPTTVLFIPVFSLSLHFILGWHRKSYRYWTSQQLQVQ